MTKITVLAAALEPFMIDLINRIIGDREGSLSFDDYFPLGNVLRIRGSTIDVFDADDDGFETANTGANSGDVILLPPKTFTSTATITDGVKIIGWSRFTTTLSGEITGGASSSIENLTVSRALSDASTLKGIISPSSGTFYINGCDIITTQSGAGDSFAVSAEVNGTIIEIWDSYLYGNAGGGGTGYGARRDGATTADMFIYGGRVRGSTDPCSE